MAKILIVDDAAFMRVKLKAILEQAGHEVIAEASDGSAAFEQYEKYKPDLVTMDVTMPEVDGVEAVQEIIEKHPDAKIIMVSAITQREIILNAIKVGAKNYLLKPYSPDKIVQTINQVLGTDNILSLNCSGKMGGTIGNISNSIFNLERSMDEIKK